ncbi:MAG: methyltransferase domain-containing protein [Rhodanobacter sp.]
MFQRHHDIYASAVLRGLLEDEARAMAADLQRCFGTHALLVGASPDDAPPALPMLGHWARLNVNNGDFGGDLRASANESLPFVDDAFELVLLRHALEVVPDASILMFEAARVLAPGGVMVVTGIHPISGWAPWFHWNSRAGQRTLQMPFQLCYGLQQAGMEIERVQRTGPFWPGGSTKGQPASALGGGFVLIARKQRRSVLPVRNHPVSMRVPANSALSAGIRRSSAS